MTAVSPERTQVVIVGAGFTGLAAAYELLHRGISATIVEADSEIGGLASAFEVGGQKLERFYHHWFTNDTDVMALIHELGLDDRVEISPSSTGMYYANRIFRLSTPLDLLRFSPLSLPDRVRLGWLALRVRRAKDWMALEDSTAREWLRELGGDGVYRVVWEPLLKGKFGPYAEDVSAVWFWNKIKLRGSSRGRGGEERLAYFQGGFAALAESLADRIRALGGKILLGTSASKLEPAGGRWRTTTTAGVIASDRVLATPALPLIADLVRPWADPEYIARLERIHYLGNVCLILELDRSLSETYWLNVNDPTFPFVGVIEHTNFTPAEVYGGRHIVYLSKYLPHTDPVYALDTEEMLDYALPHLRRMFPRFDRGWIHRHHVWRARWAQPVVERRYSTLIPPHDGPREGLHVCSMAQIYPQDRGTNYAIRDGRREARRIAGLIRGS